MTASSGAAAAVAASDITLVDYFVVVGYDSAALLQLCMPKGLRFYTQNDVPLPAVHTFANIREDGSRVNGCALIYYEYIRFCTFVSYITYWKINFIVVIYGSRRRPKNNFS
ncbi:unnamed protein product [Gongylonema pulchrum]|uniref:UDENN domain-containing protein n=1 Tax=Gongylonema pulchrum TaxID=637853 RepID=A0A183DQE7_9BILA|nr:unnamed protein product [Gongylonema pulchrum]